MTQKTNVKGVWANKGEGKREGAAYIYSCLYVRACVCVSCLQLK